MIWNHERIKPLNCILLSVIVLGIELYIVNRMSSNDGVNFTRYSLNHEKRLATNYVKVRSLLKVVALVPKSIQKNPHSSA